MDDVVDAEIVEKCLCEFCQEFVAVDLGNVCPQCSIDCVDHAGTAAACWRAPHIRELHHRMPRAHRDTTVGMPTPSEPTPLDQFAAYAQESAVSTFARAFSVARRGAVQRYGVVPVAFATAATATGIAVGAGLLASRARKRR